jgi:hypothetical protein
VGISKASLTVCTQLRHADFTLYRYLEDKKKKHKKARTEEDLDFPGREEIKFGEVVEAPPKLTVPKVSSFFVCFI